MTDEVLRGYLLGKLADSEAERIDIQLLQDEELYSRLETAEDDLFDAFARGTLDAGDRARFLERFGGARARRQFAGALARRATSGRVLSFPRRQWMPLAAAASVLIVAGALLFPRASAPTSDSVATPPATPAATQTAPASPVTSRVSLVLGTSRAAGAPVTAAIARDASAVDIRIQLNAADKYAQYGVELRSQTDLIIWGDATLRASTENGELVVHAIVPADKLPAGVYEVAVRGGASATTLEDLGFSTIEVRRP
jgi:hypothetical protein